MNWLPRMARLRMRFRKRTLLMLLLLLSGGAIVNVAVAWACARWSIPDSRTLIDISSDDAEAVWSRCAPNHWPDWRTMNAYRQQSFGVRADTVYKWDNATLDPRQEQRYSTDWNVHEYRAGWPLLIAS